MMMGQTNGAAAMPSNDFFGDSGTFDEQEPASAASTIPPEGTVRLPVDLLGVDEIFASQPDANLLVPALGISPGAPTGLFGQGYVGKTILATSVGLSVATGRPVWGIYRVRQGPVLSLDYEQGKRVTAIRTQRIARGMDVDPEALRSTMSWGILPRLRLTTPGAEDLFCRVFDGYALVILDALKGLTPGVEENSSEIRDYMGTLTRASERTGATCLLLHHAGKTPPVGNRPRKEMGRGSSGIFDECQTVFVATSEKGAAVYVSHEKDRELGSTVQDFGLRIEDVEIDGNPKAGLRVVHLEASQAKPTRDLDAEMKAGIDMVRDCIRKNPGVAGAESVRALLGIATGKVRPALQTLIATGEVVNTLRRGARLYLREAVPRDEK